jgi:hypothetical protein
MWRQQIGERRWAGEGLKAQDAGLKAGQPVAAR